MSTLFRRETAKIYEFPRKPRFRTGEPSHQGPAAVTALLQRPAGADFGSWYHEAAIQEADRSRKP